MFEGFTHDDDHKSGKQKTDKQKADKRKADEKKANKQGSGKQIARDTAQLLSQIKDIRDELNILKVVATHQRKVQDGLSTETSQDSQSAAYIINDIEEMDRIATRIHEGVSRPVTGVG